MDPESIDPPSSPDASTAGDAEKPERRPLGRSLPVAIGTGVALAIVFLGLLAVDPWVFLAFVFALVVVALTELHTAFRTAGLRPATPVAVGAGALMCFGTYATGAGALSLGVVVLLFGAMLWALLDRDRAHRADNVGATVLMGVWVPLLASFLGLLLARPDGAWLVMAAVALTVCNDIGGFAFGSWLGRHKMAPTVSPSKTWEGTLGGWTFVLALSLAATSRVPGFDGDLLLAGVFGLGVAVAGTFGDLAESLIKRDLGVKDLGRILPGHGGIMDRVDAIIFALPVAHLLLLAFGA